MIDVHPKASRYVIQLPFVKAHGVVHNMTNKIAVAPMDSAQKNSPIAGPVSDEATVVMNTASNICVWNGQEFPDGTVVESEGSEYECSFGQWTKRS